MQRSDGILGEGYIGGTPLSLLDCDGTINLERIWAGQVLPMYGVVWCGAGILGAVSRAVKLLCLPSFQKHSCCPKTGRVIRKLGVWMAWEVGENAVGRSVSQFISNFLVCWLSPRTVRSKLIRADHRRQLPRNGAAHTHTHIHVHDEMR